VRYTVGMRHDPITRPMRTSPMAVARVAIAIGPQALPPSSSTFSPRRYTQAQLFACLVLLPFVKTDDRGMCQLLSDIHTLRRVRGLKRVPHYSPRCDAHQRLMRQPHFHALPYRLWRQAQALSLLPARATGSVGAPGLEARQVSRDYVWRAGYRGFARRRWPQLTLVIDAHTHLSAGGVVSWGPSQDSPQFPAAVRQSIRHGPWDRILADTAYDAEHHHQLCRDQLAIRSTVMPLNPRRHWTRPKARYRRQRPRRCFHQGYRQRWQIERAISRHKRRLGPALRARSWVSQQRECLLRVLTHHLMILRLAA
jgi:hypothetical protein